MYLYMLIDNVEESDNGMIVMTRISWDSVSMKSVRSLSAMWGVNRIVTISNPVLGISEYI